MWGLGRATIPSTASSVTLDHSIPGHDWYGHFSRTMMSKRYHLAGSKPVLRSQADNTVRASAPRLVALIHTPPQRATALTSWADFPGHSVRDTHSDSVPEQLGAAGGGVEH